MTARSGRKVGSVAVATALVLVPALASARARVTKSHPVKLTIRQVSVSTSGNAGSPGYTETDAQLDSGTPGGSGAGTTTIVYGANATFTAKTTIFSVSGTIIARLNGTYALAANGYTIMGRGTVTGGTGRYRGARGELSFTGGQTVHSSVRTVVVRGEISY